MIILVVVLISAYTTNRYPRQEIPYTFLGRLDDPAFNSTGVTLVYTPVTNTTRQIMSKVASGSAMRGNAVRKSWLQRHRLTWPWQSPHWGEARGGEKHLDKMIFEGTRCGWCLFTCCCMTNPSFSCGAFILFFFFFFNGRCNNRRGGKWEGNGK